jgi:hypothetical protein
VIHKTKYISEVLMSMNTTINTVMNPEWKSANQHVKVQLEASADSGANHSKKQDQECCLELDRKGQLEKLNRKEVMKEPNIKELLEELDRNELLELNIGTNHSIEHDQEDFEELDRKKIWRSWTGMSYWRSWTGMSYWRSWTGRS